MKAIAAMAENRAIGKDGGLPWRIKEDFQWFKEFTMGKILIVGRKTLDTLPPLKNRNSVVLTSMSSSYEDEYNPYANIAYTFCSFEEILELDKVQNSLVCIGGAKTYELFLPYITEFYVTHIVGSYEADVFMPPFEHLFIKQEVVKEFDGHRVIKYTK